jgi:nitrate reductase assembly molybdenum cofactor insertion protein NarJ
LVGRQQQLQTTDTDVSDHLPLVADFALAMVEDDDSTSRANLSEPSWHVSPNPTDEWLTVSLPG